jgi:uncharacterized sulfatase
MKITNTLFRIATLWLITIIALRAWEAITYGIKYKPTSELWNGETLGFVNDILILGVFSTLAYGVNFIFKILKINILHHLSVVLLSIFTIGHLVFVHYFNYQQSLLDVFIFQYPVKEIRHTLATTESQNGSSYIAAALLLLLIFGLNWFLKGKNFSDFSKKILQYYLIFSIPVFFIFNYYFDLDAFAKNKSYHFYSKTLAYFFQIGNENKPYTIDDAKAFQAVFNQHRYLSNDYPLLHQFDTKDGLSAHLQTPTATPNIVLLIMEGLNDDYIHDYQGLSLMPFLSNLSEKSLYWNRCFTMGERSFAAVPSLTGGLPYGKKGFNFLEKLPNHLSLTSVLDANGYFTTFFDGQGSWFHNKDRFFKHNNLDLLIDNEKYSTKYPKIVVQDFFWGYNDKDLFNQSLEVIDTLPKEKRLDMYFTGTMHSPFSIANQPFYDEKWSKMLEKCKNDDEKRFFIKNEKYYKSILFTDDALADFFEKWKQKPNYQNTIFIITGDHPMTEIPRKNNLKRYHVPMIVFSPLLKESKVFSEKVCHLDLYETILAYLDTQKAIHAPNISTSLGGNLFFGNEKPRAFPFMNDNREIIDFLHGDYYLAENKLFNIDKDLNIKEVRNKEKKKELANELAIFKKTNFHVSTKDKIISDSLSMQNLGFHKENLTIPYKNSEKFDAEYENIIPKIKVSNKEIVFELTLKHNYIPNDDCSLVCEITDKGGKSHFWKSEKIKNNTRFSHFHFKIPKVKNTESEVTFTSFIWNPSKQKVEYNDLKFSFFTK